MPEKIIAAFGEDSAHRQVVDALIKRVSAEVGVAAKVDWRSARHGHGRVVSEVEEYLRAIEAQRIVADVLVVATDANCKGLVERTRQIPVSNDVPTVLAIPDPHIERWLLLDGAAFKAVLGHGCDAPDQKCERDRYKDLLLHAVTKAGITPNFGGIEFADDIVAKMDLTRAANADASLRRFLNDLRRALRG